MKSTGGKRIRQERFLEAFAVCGDLSRAAKAAGIDRSLHYKWLKDDRNYEEDYKKAERVLADRLRDEAMRRVFDGVERPVFFKGEEVGVIRKYSDALLMFLLRAHQPEMYNERLAAQEAKGQGIGSLNIVVEGGLNPEVFGTSWSGRHGR